MTTIAKLSLSLLYHQDHHIVTFMVCQYSLLSIHTRVCIKMYILPVGSQIILSQILAIQNSNHIQEHKYLRGKPFLFKGKNHGTNFK